MKIFLEREIEQAYQHALDGGQALHLHRCIPDPDTAPRCFVSAVARGEDIAHLFDQDYVRLVATVKKLGVNVVVVEHRGTKRQHVDLCGKPLKAAKAEAKRQVLDAAFERAAAGETEPVLFTERD